MIAAYCDESEDKHPPKSAQAFTVSGLLGHLPQFVELGRLWRLELKKHHLTDFHMADCENSQVGTPYERMQKPQREFLQRCFMDIIVNKCEVWQFATGVELEPYRSRWELLERNRQKFVKPYYLAFQHEVENMSKQLDRGGFARDECIAFTFDRQKEYEGVATELYDWLLHGDHDNITYSHRLGSLSFESRLKFVELQGSDVFAYESRRYFREAVLQNMPVRWQWEMFRSSKRGELRAFTGEALDQVATLCGWT